ncbi:hypothetical protein PVL29_019504 [Vitis rotundifolia]|uniref:Pentatricopeptide repeat-containing protein n=1 Tax=Vitis rotundifolia TaxID=103349 RepID=A0AA38Z179_VITRO|nr:hypothetical protein PVL29_019504 [Vitis rotundifolia]
MKRSDAVPNKFTYPSLIKACSKVCAVKEGVTFHGLAMRCGVGGDVFVMMSLIDLYGKCGRFCVHTRCLMKCVRGMWFLGQL